MALFGKPKAGGFMDVIRCDEPSYLIWKWHPTGSQSGNNKRENAIRWGSSLRVKDGEVAVFVYKKEDDEVQDFILGPFDETIKTKNLPIIANIIGLAYAGDTPFQAEVYFINLAKVIQVKFAVPYFEVYDPQFQDIGVPVAVRGTISFHIADYREFIKLHRLIDFRLEQFQFQIKDAVARYVKNIVTNVPHECNMPLIQIERKTAEITDKIEAVLSERLEKDFGVIVAGIDIGAIDLDKLSPEYARLMSVTQDVTTATVYAQTEANLKNISEMQRIQAKNYEESLRIQREESQYAQHMATQATNITAFQTEKQAEVGVAGAQALGQMGANGAGGIDLGDGSTGFNPAAMMASMALGGVVGQNMAGMMNNVMGGMNQTPPITPPPVPTVTYHVAINGQATGPYDVARLKQMVTTGSLTKESLVWTVGMSEWMKAGAVDELKNIFMLTPPIPPAF